MCCWAFSLNGVRAFLSAREKPRYADRNVRTPLSVRRSAFCVNTPYIECRPAIPNGKQLLLPGRLPGE